MTARLVAPELSFMPSLIEALKEGYKLTNTEPEIPEPPEKIAGIEADPAGFLHGLLNPPQMLTLPGGLTCERPAQTHYWYVDGERFLGSGVLRMTLPPQMAAWAGQIGYAVRPSERGRGHARHIVEALLQKARDEHGAARIEVCAEEQNLPSLRVIEKVGGVPDGVADFPLPPFGRVRRYWIEL